MAIFDADFTPPEDFLLRVIHHFSDPKIGMVQTRWTHLNRHYSFLTEVEAILLDGHFVLEHSGRARTGLFFNFNGTARIGAGPPSMKPEAGSTTRSPKTPTSLIAPNSKDGSSFTCRMSNVPRNFPSI